MATTYTLGVYDDDEKVLHAVEQLQHEGLKVHDVFSPFPIHGIDPLLGLKRSRLPKAAFWFGALGLTLALTMQWWMMGVDWPMDISGKPSIPWPSFVPVTFELTVLLSALGMVGTYLVASKMGPGAQAVLADLRQTDDRFVILMRTANDDATRARQLEAYQRTGAVDVRVAELEL